MNIRKKLIKMNILLFMILVTCIAIVITFGVSKNETKIINAQKREIFATSGTCGTCSWTIDNNGKLTIGAGTLKKIDYQEHPNWYSYRSSIKSVYVNSGVKTNTSCFALFQDCSNLVSADLTNLNASNAKHFEYIFDGCSSLTSVKVPKSVTNIGSEAFYMCTNLTSVTVLDSVNSIGKWAFYGCDNLTIYGYDNSFAQSYAADNSIPFIIVSDDESLTGDTNLDGKISISDVTAIQRHLAESEQFTNRQLALADTNGDGIIDINDATHLQKFLAEFESTEVLK